MIDNHQVTVISGETGCGKTTQVTQFILDNYIERGKGSACRIVCTQPRRISAISVSYLSLHFPFSFWVVLIIAFFPFFFFFPPRSVVFEWTV